MFGRGFFPRVRASGPAKGDVIGCLRACTHEADAPILHTNVDSYGKIEIPVRIRAAMQISAGTRVVVERDGDKIILVPITDAYFDSLRGITTGAGQAREKMHKEDER